MTNKIFLIFIGGHKTHGKNYLSELLISKNFNEKNNYKKILFNDSYLENEFEQILNADKYYTFAFADKLKLEYCVENKISYTEFENNKEILRKYLQKFSEKKLKENKNYYTNIVYEKNKSNYKFGKIK